MPITIIVHVDAREVESEMDARVARLEKFIADKAEEVFRDARLDSYLEDGLSNAKVLHRARMYPQEQDNIDVVEAVEARAWSCWVCAHYRTLLIFATCLGTREEYVALREVMNQHFSEECWSTTILDDGFIESWA